METYIRRPTKTTPYVHFDVASGMYVIAGRSIPIDADFFYRPILDWVDGLLKNPPHKVQFCFRFDFFNIASSKRVLFLLYKLVELKKQGTQTSVRWMYDKADEDMLELGRDYACMIEELHFDFEQYDVSELNKSRILKLG
jgi:hypothetical protein